MPCLLAASRKVEHTALWNVIVEAGGAMNNAKKHTQSYTFKVVGMDSIHSSQGICLPDSSSSSSSARVLRIWRCAKLLRCWRCSDPFRSARLHPFGLHVFPIQTLPAQTLCGGRDVFDWLDRVAYFNIDWCTRWRSSWAEDCVARSTHRLSTVIWWPRSLRWVSKPPSPGLRRLYSG